MRASTIPIEDLLFLARIELMTNPTITTYTMRDGKEHNRRAANPWAALTDSMDKFASAAERAGRQFAAVCSSLRNVIRAGERMSALDERIVTVLAEHRPVWAVSIDMLVRCDCGHGHDIAGYDNDGHDAHQAEMVAALFAEEWAVRYDGETIPEETVYDRPQDASEVAQEKCQSCDTCRGADPRHVVSRWTSTWEATGA